MRFSDAATSSTLVMRPASSASRRSATDASTSGTSTGIVATVDGAASAGFDMASPGSSSGSADRGLLLGDAVDASAAGEDRPRITGDAPPPRVDGSEDLARPRVGGGLAVAARDHAVVHDEVVDVVPVDEALVVAEGLGRRHVDDAPAAA